MAFSVLDGKAMILAVCTSLFLAIMIRDSDNGASLARHEN
jgi:hypothetical protein